MKTLTRLFLVLLVSGSAISQASVCRYFRVKFKPVSCLPSASDAENMYAIDEDSVTIPPELAEAKAEPGFDVTCACTYTLQGSDPLCDTEREEEYTTRYPDEKNDPVCRRMKTLCTSICPKIVP